FIRYAVTYIVEQAKKAGYFNANVDFSLWVKHVQLPLKEKVEVLRPDREREEVERVADARVVLKLMIKQMLEHDQNLAPRDENRYFNLYKAVHNFGLSYSEPQWDLASAIASELSEESIPRPLDGTFRTEFEDDKGPLRAKEMDMRIANVRAMI